MYLLNNEVTQLLNTMEHPLRKEIDLLRQEILSVNAELTENIKWNSPNYSFQGDDRITMRVQPTKQIQLVFHRGAKVLKQPANRLINDGSGLLTWKTNDRAVATFKNEAEISAKKIVLQIIIKEWLAAATKKA